MAAVRDALLVAGGLGTRMLPTSASVPKEALPLVDVPALIHLAREAVAAGVQCLHIISSPRKDLTAILGDHSWLQDRRPDLDQTLLSPFSDIKVKVHIQHEPLGLGNAIETALDDVSGPFLVLLGDNILLDSHTPTNEFIPSNASKKLVENFEKKLAHYLGTRYSLLTNSGSSANLLASFALINPKKKDRIEKRLLHLHDEILSIIKKFDPSVMAIEDSFYGKNVKLSLIHISEPTRPY